MMLLRALLVLMLLVPVSAQAAWREARTRHFRIYSEGSVPALREFAIKVERFDTLLRTRYGVSDADDPQVLTIFMLPNGAAVERLIGGADRKGIRGFYEPHAGGSLAVVHREAVHGQYNLDADTLLFHEYAHHFMIANFPGAYPAWFIEGFAEFISTTDFTRDGNAKLGVPPYYRAFGLLQQAAIPTQRLVTSTVSDFPTMQLRDSFYGRSWLLVHYLYFSESRKGQFARYLDAINAGKSSLDAATATFGDLAQLDRELKAYLARQKLSSTMMVKPTPTPDRVDVAELSTAAGALVLHRLAVMRWPEKASLPGLIAALRALTLEFPQEADAQLLLGEAEYAADNDAAAEAAADAALAIDPRKSRAMLLKGNAQMRRYIRADNVTGEQWKTMRSWIVKANRADTNDPLPLIAYYNTWGAQGIAPNPVSLDGLRRAHQMAPEDMNVRMTYAFSLAKAKNYDAAIRLVETVAYAPHESGGTRSARTILARIKAAKAGRDTVDEVPDLIIGEDAGSDQ